MKDAPRAVKLTRADEQRAEKLYNRKWRQIRRWIDKGEHAGDPCPLFEQEKMPAWWVRNSTHRVPAVIEAAAIAAAKGEAPGDGPTAVRATDSRAAASAAAPEPPEPAEMPIELASLQSDDADSALAHLRQVRAATGLQLADAFRRGLSTDVLQSRYLKTGQALRQLEKDDREDKVARGLYLPRKEFERDALILATMMVQLFEFMPRRVEERCPALDQQQRAEVRAAIGDTTAQCKRIFARLETLDSPTAFLEQLAAA